MGFFQLEIKMEAYSEYFEQIPIWSLSSLQDKLISISLRVSGQLIMLGSKDLTNWDCEDELGTNCRGGCQYWEILQLTSAFRSGLYYKVILYENEYPEKETAKNLSFFERIASNNWNKL